MSAQGLEVIDRTVHLTHEWINELTERLDWTSAHDALRLMRATLTAVRDHISHEEAAQLSAQMPLLIRGMFFEGWQPAQTPMRDRNVDHFISRIETTFGASTEYRGPEDITTVFKLLNARISDGEVKDVRGALPEAIRSLWPG
ncbi:DUF2267 domain-containing protein [Aliiroseovarius sp. M344]|uniref:DUF2267 domain-containing protein n=1 Tax=Aliiroseovarius sp. M344 TaxID=2867010 RepID=UPI0021AD6E46|nr:DUF2267 domain-containing protein [Aliiroseovarius sp. M344]UWQ14241.1 DUF2267 domain-containing protein [Aliiroseovarius sp. M344]